MKLTLEEMKEIAKRLPIGFYLGRKTPVIVEPMGGAYCDVAKGDIHIGLPLLQVAADNISPADAAKWDRETLLRCLLYHEIGHLLLTPRWLGELKLQHNGNVDPDSKALVNIFEDERLERLLESSFMGVDFSGFCQLVNKGGSFNTRPARFIDAVRLRRTTQEISTMIDDAISDLSCINTTTHVIDSVAGMYAVNAYMRRLQSLVDKILPEEQQQQEQQEQQEQGESKGESKPDPNGGTPENKPDEGESDEQQQQGGGDETQNGDDEGNKDDKSKPAGNPEPDSDQENEGEDNTAPNPEDESEGDDEEESQDSTGGNPEDDGDDGQDGDGNPEDGGTAVAPRKFNAPPNLLASLTSKIFATPTLEVERVLGRFASRLAKKKGAQAAGRWSGLHGRISTKRDAMDMERIFRRSSDIGERLMSSVNLTLWIDVSGSFRRSRDMINQILSAVARTEKNAGGKLAVNVVKMKEYASVAVSSDWAVDPCGGNDINHTYYDAWRNTRQKDRRNIDIVVFDGQACHRYRGENSRVGGKLIERVIWDHPDCHIISDTDNKFLFGKFKKAHVTWMSTGYAERLQSEVIKILDRIL